MKNEGENILNKIGDDEFVITLEIEGKMLDSKELATLIDNKKTYGTSKITFVIGGSNGLTDKIINSANKVVSFGKITYPHQLMRVILLEQIYRCYRIINGEPYHK